MPYETWLPKQAPPWLQGPGGAAVLSTIGKMFDRGRLRAHQSTISRFPDRAAAADDDNPPGLEATDAVNEIGEDRLIERVSALDGSSSETDVEYAERLREAWDTWEKAGTFHGLFLALKRAGFPMGSGTPPSITRTMIVQYNGRFAQMDDDDEMTYGELDDCENRQNLIHMPIPDPRPGWFFDAIDRVWSTFGIVFPMEVDLLTNDTGNVPKAKLNALVRKWKPAKARYAGAWIMNETTNPVYGWPPTTLDDDQRYGEDLDYGGSDVTYIGTE